MGRSSSFSHDESRRYDELKGFCSLINLFICLNGSFNVALVLLVNKGRIKYSALLHSIQQYFSQRKDYSEGGSVQRNSV